MSDSENADGPFPREKHDGVGVLASPVMLGIQIVGPATLIFIMFGLGCNLVCKDAKEGSKKRPVGMIVGVMSQFALMPLLGFACVMVLSLNQVMACGTVILACCPGVWVSVFFTNWVRAEITLSAALTGLCSLLALAVTPFTIFIYTRIWSLDIDFINFGYIAIIVAVMLLPLGLGVLLRAKVGHKMKTAANVMFPMAIFLALIYIVLVIIGDPGVVFGNWRPWICAWLFSLLALIIGYLCGFCACLHHSECRTVALEMSCQNVALAVTIISVLFPLTERTLIKMMIVPVLYEVFMYINCSLFMVLYRVGLNFRSPRQDDTRKMIRTPSQAGSVSTVNTLNTVQTGVTAGSITTVLPPGSYVNYGLDLQNSYNKSFAPVVRFDPDTEDIGNKYGHQTVQTPGPDGDDGGFGEAGFKTITPRKYQSSANPEAVDVEMKDSRRPDDTPKSGKGKKGLTQIPTMTTPDTNGPYPPKPIGESTPARPPLPLDNFYESEPRRRGGYSNYAVADDDERPVQSPRSRFDDIDLIDDAPRRPPLPDEYAPEAQYEDPDSIPKHQVTLDPRRDIHSGDYRDYHPDNFYKENSGYDNSVPSDVGYYPNDSQKLNGDANVTESEV
ncbi:hepatic sodium/bile acid cotransporter-like [Glandiceps talaboti]